MIRARKAVIGPLEFIPHLMRGGNDIFWPGTSPYLYLLLSGAVLPTPVALFWFRRRRYRDADGDVDGTDFGIWQANYPTNMGGSAMTTTPEPATLGVLLIAGLAMLRRRR